MSIFVRKIKSFILIVFTINILKKTVVIGRVYCYNKL